MGRPALEVADIFRDHGPAWRDANRGHVSLGQLKVMSAIERCRTAALGGHVMRCENDACAYTVIAYNSCRNRHCPKCQGAVAREWMAARAAELLPVPYFHVALGDRRYRVSEQGGDLRPPVRGLGRDHAHHRGRSQASRRPHRHHLGAAHVGKRNDAPSTRAHDRAGRRHLARWITLDRQAARLLSAGARALEAVPQVDDREAGGRTRGGSVDVHGAHAALVDAKAFAAYLAPLKRTRWFVYAKRPFAGPKAVLAYLSRYTHRVAISNRRLIAADAKTVTFKVKDYRIDGPGRDKTMTLDAHEFIRRFPIHVLPKGFHRIRHYGLLASGTRAVNIARARELIADPVSPEPPDTTETPAADQARLLQRPCPHCGGRMFIIETFARGCEPKHRPTPVPAAIGIDTS
jgi:hypothetical protein